MKDITTYDLLKDVISGVSNGRFNKKALNEVIESFNNNRHDYDEKLNIILKDYYERVHNNKKDFYEFFRIKDQKDLDFIKESYNAKRYKTKYDYTLPPYPIKQRNTGLVIEYNNGYRGYISYAFDVYAYIKSQKLNVIDL